MNQQSRGRKYISISKIETCWSTKMRTEILIPTSHEERVRGRALCWGWSRGPHLPWSTALHSLSPHLQIPTPAHTSSIQSLGNIFPSPNLQWYLLIFRQRDTWTIYRIHLSIKEILNVFNFHIIFLFLCKHAGGLFTITPRNIGDIIMEHCTFSDPRIRMQLLTRKEGAAREN